MMALTVSANALLKVADLGEGGVLAACAQEVAQGVDLDTAVTALVEEGEGLLEVGGLRLLVGHAWLVSGLTAVCLRLWVCSAGVCDCAVPGVREDE